MYTTSASCSSYRLQSIVEPVGDLLPARPSTRSLGSSAPRLLDAACLVVPTRPSAAAPFSQRAISRLSSPPRPGPCCPLAASALFSPPSSSARLDLDPSRSSARAARQPPRHSACAAVSAWSVSSTVASAPVHDHHILTRSLRQCALQLDVLHRPFELTPPSTSASFPTCEPDPPRLPPPLPLHIRPLPNISVPRSNLRICRRDSAAATSYPLDHLPDYLLDLLLAVVGVTGFSPPATRCTSSSTPSYASTRQLPPVAR